MSADSRLNTAVLACSYAGMAAGVVGVVGSLVIGAWTFTLIFLVGLPFLVIASRKARNGHSAPGWGQAENPQRAAVIILVITAAASAASGIVAGILIGAVYF